MTIQLEINNPCEQFTQISNQLLRDNNLSFEARGLICYLLSHKTGYCLNKKQLEQDTFKCGRDKLDTIIKESMKAGYLHLVLLKVPETRKFKGRMWLITGGPISKQRMQDKINARNEIENDTYYQLL